MPVTPRFLDFFAGSGLVSEALRGHFRPVWANDISPKKAEVYRANHGREHFHEGDITRVTGDALPPADLAWASSPCQDLSLAGRMGGLEAARSGMLWQWLRILDEMPERTPLLVVENVVGLLSSAQGRHYHQVHEALVDRGYRVGPVLLNACDWLPQSRPRVFVVAAREDLDTSRLEDSGPNWLHPEPIRKALAAINDPVYWTMPAPSRKPPALAELVEWDAPCIEDAKAERLLSQIAPAHWHRLMALPPTTRAVFPGYRRTRQGKPVIELRFDGIAGCLRTAEGGSSRQFLVLFDHGEVSIRLLTAREAALLMGAPSAYQLPENYNEAYNAMGDAVAVPAVRHLGAHLLRAILDSPRSLEAPPAIRLIA